MYWRENKEILGINIVFVSLVYNFRDLFVVK